MDSIFLFIFFSLILLFIAWHADKKDVLAPGVLINVSFIWTAFLYISAAERLHVGYFLYETTFLLLSATACFMIGNALARKLIGRHNTPYTELQLSNITGVSPIKLLFLLVAFAACIAIIQIFHMRSLVGMAGIASLVLEFREGTFFEDLPQNSIVAIGSRILNSCQAVIILYLIYYQMVYKNNTKHKRIIVFLLILHMVCIYIIFGARSKIINVILQLMFCYIICAQVRKNKGKYKNKWKRNLLLSILLIIPIFYYVGLISGRDYEKFSAFESVENYFAVGLFRINNFINGENIPSEHWGQWSFSGLYSLMNKLGGKYGDYDFFPFYGIYGNTSTLYGRWYIDFGIIGVCILSLWNGFLYSFFYYKMKYAKNGKEAFVFSSIYVHMMGTILMAGYDDWTRGFYTLNGIFQFLLVVLVSKWLYKKHLKDAKQDSLS